MKSLTQLTEEIRSFEFIANSTLKITFKKLVRGELDNLMEILRWRNF